MKQRIPDDPVSIRQAVIKAVERQGHTAYSLTHAIKEANDGEFAVSHNHINEYLAGRKDMTSEKVDWLLRVLGLVIARTM